MLLFRSTFVTAAFMLAASQCAVASPYNYFGNVKDVEVSSTVSSDIAISTGTVVAIPDSDPVTPEITDPPPVAEDTSEKQSNSASSKSAGLTLAILVGCTGAILQVL